MTQEEREKMIVDNMPLVKYLLSSSIYLNRSKLEYEDALQQGYIELIKAVDNFDSSLGFKFSSYAKYKIRYGIFEARMASELIPIKTLKDRKIYGFGLKTSDIPADDNCSHYSNASPIILKEKKKTSKICVICGKKIQKRKYKVNSHTPTKFCSIDCARHSKKPQDVEQLLNDVKKMGYIGTGKKYGVSDTTIRKWIKNA